MKDHKMIIAFLITFFSFHLRKCQIPTNQPASQEYSENPQDYSENPQDYKIVRSQNINAENCRFPFAYQVKQANQSTCYCTDGFANYPFQGNNGLYCAYSQKKQLTSFLLELLIPFGFGHYIIGRITAGNLKFLFALIPCLIGCCGPVCNSCAQGYGGLCVMVAALFYIIYIIWYFYDLIWFGMNYYRDGNGVPLQSW